MAQPNEFNLKAIFNEIVDIEILVDLVQDRPVIWDKTAEGYRNRDVSISAWEQIFRIMFPNYESLSVDQKKFIGKVIKDKWTATRDIWQRNHRKRKKAMLKGESVPDFKDNARHEKLMFLAKLYDKEDHLQLVKEDKVLDPNLENIGLPKITKPDPDDENFLNVDNADLQRKFVSVLMNHKTPQKPGFNVPSKRRKLENINVANNQVKNEQGTSPHKPGALNFGNKINTSVPSTPSKDRTSFVDRRDINQSSSIQIQSSKFEKISPNTIKKEMPLSSNSHLMKNNTVRVSQKLALKSPSQLFHQENLQSSSNEISSKLELVENTGPKHEAPTQVEQKSLKTPSQNNNSANSEHDKFFQILRPRLEEFSKTQIIDFFLEMLKPRINDFDKHQLLDFQIEALQLIKKMEGN